MCVVSVVLVARPMRSADPGGRAGGGIGRAPAESGTRMYCGSVVGRPDTGVAKIGGSRMSDYGSSSG